MNNFFKTFFAALLAFVVGSILTVIIFSMMLAGFAALFTPKAPVVSSGSVLKIDLQSSIVDSPRNVFRNFDFATMTVKGTTTILDAVSAIEEAAKDSKIRGIFINIDGDGTASISNIEELRAAVERFKESGKFVVSYDNSFTHAGYYLASVGDKVAMNPQGNIQWMGITASVMFYKGLFDKLDIGVDVIRHGSFKSAVEPYILDGMSPENRMQISKYANSMWSILLDDISKSRGISAEQLNSYADNLSVGLAEDALKLGFVDNLWYRDQVYNYVAALAEGVAEADYDESNEYDKPNYVSLNKYAEHVKLNKAMHKSGSKIGVIYADGQIVDGSSGNDMIGGDDVARLISRARKDDDIKAVVFRVNSPGGSALASEVIWREIELLKAEKPVIVSMGSYAASGGYYISAPADVIIANRATLTGSIGVFGLLMNFENTLKNKLGITVDVVNTNSHSSMGNGFSSLKPNEKAFIQNQVESIYNVFVGHVSNGRNMTFEAVDAIGQGRVWLGKDAMDIGLIDGFGGIMDAVNLAADRAAITGDFSIEEIQDTETSFMNMILNMSASVSEARMQDKLGELYMEYSSVKNMIEEGDAIQAMMPYRIEVK